MPKKSDYVDFTESGNWNVAADYVKLKIMKHLYLADEYELTAIFGTGEMVDEFITNEQMKVVGRLKALKRLRKTLDIIINNTIFAVKKDDKPKLEDLYKELTKWDRAMIFCEIINYDMRTKSKTIKINETVFKKVLDGLIKIKKDLNEPLNRANLIFTEVEEFDPDKFKAEIAEDMIYGG